MNDVPFTAGDELRAALAGDTPDLISSVRSRLALMQTNNPETVRVEHNKRYHPEAQAGGFLCTWADGTRTAFNDGVVCSLVGFDLRWIEYHLDRGAERGKFIKSHTEEPADYKWLKVGQLGMTKEGGYRLAAAAGKPYSRCVKMLFAYLLIEGKGAVLAFYSTMLADGFDFVNQANRLQVKSANGGEPLRGYALGRWRITSRPVERGGRPYFRPAVTLVGRLGELGGPSVEEVFAHNAVRQAFLKGLPWELEQPQIEDYSGAPLPLARDWTPPAPSPVAANDQSDELNPPPADEHDYAGQPEPWDDEIPF
jgi:hypothetical protein